MFLHDIVAPLTIDEAKATKTRLDPKCWAGKKIGNPKTKVKGGVRVNNCVPANEDSNMPIANDSSSPVGGNVKETLGPDKNDPWEKGWRAGFRHNESNPYPAGSNEAKQWDDGYAEAEAQPNHYDEGVESDMPDLEAVGEPVESMMDAERRLAAGDRIFVAHEMDDEPFEIFNVGDLRGYTYDQMLAVPQGVAEGTGETPQQQKVRTAISNGLAKSSQMGKSEYQSQPTKRTYFDNAGYASDKLTGIDSIDPDGTVVISMGDTRAGVWVKKLATLGGMPGVKTREAQPKKDVAEVRAGVDDTDTVGFSVNSEAAYTAVMKRFGDYIDHDETSGIMYAPARVWPQIEMVAFDADGEGATRDDGVAEVKHFKTSYGYAGGSKPGGGQYRHPEQTKADSAAKKTVQAQQKNKQSDVAEGDRNEMDTPEFQAAIAKMKARHAQDDQNFNLDKARELGKKLAARGAAERKTKGVDEDSWHDGKNAWSSEKNQWSNESVEDRRLNRLIEYRLAEMRRAGYDI